MMWNGAGMKSMHGVDLCFLSILTEKFNPTLFTNTRYSCLSVVSDF